MNKELLIAEMREAVNNSYESVPNTGIRLHSTEKLVTNCAEVAMKHLPQWASVDMEKFYSDYTEWAVGTFGLDNPKHGATKLVKEAKELEENPTDIIEQADCLMCLLYNFKCAHPDKPISELLGAAMRKLEINKNRKWVRQPDGTYQHEKPLPEPPKQ